MYQGTSLWLWVVQGIIWCFVAALVIAIGLALLAAAALVGLAIPDHASGGTGRRSSA